MVDAPMLDDVSDQFEILKQIGSGSFGVCHLARDRLDGEEVAVKLLPRGPKIDRNVEREVIVHSLLRHPNIVGFKRIFLTSTHLGIAMEYATGGELFNKVKASGRFDEDTARFFFQQLVQGVQYCHQNGVAHRDLKLENTLVKLEQVATGVPPTPVLKIADFGFCKHEALDTPPKSRVGTPAYISPEVLRAPNVYDGKASDVWSSGVHLYIMLVGWYPFTDPREPQNFHKTAGNITRGKFAFPSNVAISQECKDLIRRMLRADPATRITIADILKDPWFTKNLSRELQDGHKGLPCYGATQQPAEEIRHILQQARRPVPQQ